MTVFLLSENLQKKLTFVNHAVSNRNQLPILSNFLIEAKKGFLSISATDLEIGIKTEIATRVGEEGATTVSAKTFLELMGNIPSGKITLQTQAKGLELKGEKIKTVFQTIPPDDFPALYQKKGDLLMSAPREGVLKEFPRVVFAASSDAGRPALSGVLVRGEEDGGFLLVATDGFRLSLKKHALENKAKRGLAGGISVLVPARVIKEFVLMEEDNEEINVYLSKESNQIMFCQNETTLVGRLIEGEFPSFEKIIPTDFSTRVFFDKGEIQRAVKTCHIFARETANIVKLSIKKERVIVSANAPSVGENMVEVEAKTEGEENEIAFNARYLLELFSNIGEEEMVFEMTGPLNPGVFKIKNDESFLHLIMPIRVQG